jgi:hypothetical protein
MVSLPPRPLPSPRRLLLGTIVVGISYLVFGAYMMLADRA